MMLRPARTFGSHLPVPWSIRWWILSLAVLVFICTGCGTGPEINGRAVEAFSRRGLKSVKVWIESAPGGTKTLSTDSKGRFSGRLSEDFAGTVKITLTAQGFPPRTLTLQLPDKGKVALGTLSVVPDAGLYIRGQAIPLTTFRYSKRAMVGLAVPAYYDGTYFVSGEPTEVALSPVEAIHWVPKHGQTLGENPFAVGSKLHCFPVLTGGEFVQYERGRSVSRRPSLRATTVTDTINSGPMGLTQQKVEAFRMSGYLPPGDYVFFQGGGNALDNESHPDEALGCWYVRISNATQRPAEGAFDGASWQPASMLVLEDTSAPEALQSVLSSAFPADASVIAQLNGKNRYLVLARAGIPLSQLPLPSTTHLLAVLDAGLVNQWTGIPMEGQFLELKVENLDLSDAARLDKVQRQITSPASSEPWVAVSSASAHPMEVTLVVLSEEPISEDTLSAAFGSCELRYDMPYRLVRRR